MRLEYGEHYIITKCTNCHNHILSSRPSFLINIHHHHTSHCVTDAAAGEWRQTEENIGQARERERGRQSADITACLYWRPRPWVRLSESHSQTGPAGNSGQLHRSESQAAVSHRSLYQHGFPVLPISRNYRLLHGKLLLIL